jgi:hypothetical protein
MLGGEEMTNLDSDDRIFLKAHLEHLLGLAMTAEERCIWRDMLLCVEDAGRLSDYIESEEELSDAYLRIRAKLDAWDTKHAGADRFDVTEKALDDVIAERDAALARVEELEECIEEALTSPAVCVYDDLRALLDPKESER